MGVIEQAILHVTDHRDVDSARFLAKTSGVMPLDVEELVAWATCFELDPRGSDYLETTSNISHIYFHPLPSGAHVLGNVSLIPTNPTAKNSSGFNEKDDSGHSYYVHCLVISPEILKAFHNNVVTLYHSLQRAGFRFFEYTDVSGNDIDLAPIEVGGPDTPLIDRELLEAFYDYPGPTSIVTLLMASMDSVCTFLIGGPPTLQLINGLIQCLPVAWRLELSFATSLHFSQMRPLRIMVVQEQSQAVRNICHSYAVPLLNLLHTNQKIYQKKLLKRRGWPAFVYRLFELKRYEILQRQLTLISEKQTSDLEQGSPDWQELNQLGADLLEKFENNQALLLSDINDANLHDAASSVPLLAPEVQDDAPVYPKDGHAKDQTRPEKGGLFRGDFAHPVFMRSEDFLEKPMLSPLAENQFESDNLIEKVLEQDTKVSVASQKNDLFGQTQQQLSRTFPKYENEIRQMDSLIARSLFGDHLALEMLDAVWRELYRRLSLEERGMIRETYIKLVQSVITHPRDPAYPKHPRRSVDALEVLNIFLEE